MIRGRVVITGRDRIESIVAVMGWDSIPSPDNPLVWRYRKPNSKRSVRVYFGIRGQVISAAATTATSSQYVLGADKAGQLVDFIAVT